MDVALDVRGWFQDALDELGNTESEAVVLTGGIRGWIQSHPDLAVAVHSFPDAN